MKMSQLKCLQIAVLLIGLSTMVFSHIGFAGDVSPATVTFASGNVQIIDANKQAKSATKNTAVNVGDTIETNDGRVQLAFADGGKVSIQPHSVYKIDKFAFYGTEDGSEYNFTELVKGGLRTITGLVGHTNRGRYQLKTAVATIGIRGTEFTLNFNNNQLLMTTNHGSVDVCNNAGCLNAMTGQSISVDGFGAKPKPSPVAAVAAASAPAKAKDNQNNTADNTATASNSASNNAANQANTFVASLDNGAANANKKTEVSKAVFAESEQVTKKGVPVVLEQEVEKNIQIQNNVGQGVINPNNGNNGNNGNNVPAPSLKDLVGLAGQFGVLMKSNCLCGNDEIANALIDTNGNSAPTVVDTAQQAITFNNFNSVNSDGIIGWGRADGKFSNNNVAEQPIEWMDYLIGEKPDALQLANLSGTYTVFGSTPPMLITSGVSTPVESANKVTGTFNFNFANTNYNYNLIVKTNFDNFNLTGNGNVTATNPTFASNSGQSNITSTGLTCVANNCNPGLSGNKLVQGAFFGKNGERVGLQYGIYINNLNQLYGSAVLK